MSGVPPLAEVQRLIHGLLRGDVSPREVSLRLGAKEDHVALYARFVRAHVTGVLEKNYSRLAQALVPEAWQSLTEAYFRDVPPRSYELNQAAASFPDYVAERARRGELGLSPAHAELAALEWLEFCVYVTPVEIPGPEEITAPTLNPTLEILSLEYPMADFAARIRRGEVRRGEDGAELPPRLEAPQTVFVFRNPRNLRARIRVADDALLFAFKVAHDRLAPLEAAAEAGLAPPVVQAILGRAESEGILLLPAGRGAGRA